ncbi:MAG: pyridoxal phosphate-dependent aminotransferase [Chthonomonadaceae bacterium]|nr:pyridoxal phosphate-dependent aminotransferase [Chthonomonadaceae bacterium]
MPKVSERSLKMPASPIRRLMPFAEEAVRRGTVIYHLNIGQPDVESPREFWDAVQNTGLRYLEYTHSAGRTDLREKVAARYRDMGIEVEASQVMVCTAGSEALAFAMMACLNPGDEVILPEPFYANYLSFAMSAGVEIMPLETRIEDGFALPAVSEFRAKLTPRTKAILINNPGNPTGTIYDPAQLDGLRQLALERNLFLISDEVYREFNYTSSPVLSILQLEGLDEHAVMVDSVSKRFSLCGARIGFLVSRNKAVNENALKYAQARLAPPLLEQLGVLGALDAPKSYFDQVREEYRTRRDLLVSRLRAMSGVVCPLIDGAFYAMVELPIDDSDRFCRWLLESFDHRGETVMLSPATGFYSRPELGLRQVRIAYVLEKDKLNRAMDCLEAALQTYPGRVNVTAAAKS